MNYESTRVTLIQRIKNRLDENSWEEFTRWYSPYIMAILNRSGVPLHQVEDLNQDILLSIWKSIENFEYKPSECTFRTWLSTISRNKIYDFFARQKTKSNYESSTVIPTTLEKSEIDIIIEREWRLYIAGKAFEKVSQQFNEKAIQAYREFQSGKDVPDISQKLEISESSVYVYNKRVKDAMSREIILLSRDLE
ncbi:sigma-70 family RNA polymerase sigma factor [Lentisphaera profundi]|uniref:Sigma-70 family RNA polymerase sigma factor n=1 Tax=Lentisphaera profundi TaxID=1658616 RepID=A0ABY7VSD2_9BACT|nr:sigma-70 family RNA polymerase sigma factor [Lentisphaera profundi]WDE97115.1 sigma-70 family RNA polymerase sigma factor [Lentisphaera profundi]